MGKLTTQGKLAFHRHYLMRAASDWLGYNQSSASAQHVAVRAWHVPDVAGSALTAHTTVETEHVLDCDTHTLATEVDARHTRFDTQYSRAWLNNDSRGKSAYGTRN